MTVLLCTDNHSWSDDLINDYLTVGKSYNLFSPVVDGGFIYDDDGDRIFVNYRNSDHGTFKLCEGLS